MAKQYWLVKSEPDVYSIDQLKKDGHTTWNGVRNYQARNFMRDGMKLGDGVLFYYSSCDVPAIVGQAEVSKAGCPDPTQFDKKSEFYDPSSKPDKPTWIMVEIKYVKTFGRPLTLTELKTIKSLENMVLLKRGRLSVQPVSPEEWKIILGLTSKG